MKTKRVQKHIRDNITLSRIINYSNPREQTIKIDKNKFKKGN